jgi:alcohol dehydrogenase
MTIDLYTETPAEVPLGAVEDCIARARVSRPDVVIGFGGGSTMDMAKLAALGVAHSAPLESFYGENLVPAPCVPVIALPTTAGTGSEVSPVAVLEDTSRQTKVGIASPHLVPMAAICDPEVTLSCPPSVTAYSGMDALVHAVESFTARRREAWGSDYPGTVFVGKNALSDLHALQAIRLIGCSLERAVDEPEDVDARANLLYASLLAGLAFSRSGTAGAHALQYPIGTLTKTPHGLGVGLLLPYVLEFVLPAALDTLPSVARSLGVDVEDELASARNAIQEIARLRDAVGLPHSLPDIGLERRHLPDVVLGALKVTRLLDNSPRPLDEVALTQILESALNDNDRTG